MTTDETMKIDYGILNDKETRNEGNRNQKSFSKEEEQ
jgi:hypothetical protein